MARNRTSARQAGSRFERQIADHLNQHVDDGIDRRVKRGQHDRGDVAGLKHMGNRIVVEAKNTARVNLATWMAEAHLQAGNDDALIAMVISKRHGNNKPGDQWVHMTLNDLIALLTGSRPEEEA